MMNAASSNKDMLSIILPWMLLVFILSLPLALILIRGLQAQPLSKQCLLLKMYQDALRMNLVSVWIWCCSSVIWCLLEPEENIYKSLVAEGIAFVDQIVVLTLLQNLILIGVLRILTIKLKVLDPLSNWFEDENIALWAIRMSIVAVAIVVIILVYCSSSIPPVYYMIEDGNMENLSTGSKVILTMDIILLLTCAIIHITGTFLHKYEGAKLARKYMYEERSESMGNRRGMLFFNKCFLHETQNDSFNTSYNFQRDYVPVICSVVNSFVILGGITVLCYVPIYFMTKQIFWAMIALFIGNQGVVIPMLIIYKNASFRVYLKRMFLPIKELMSSFIISTRVCRRRDARVHNLDDLALPQRT